VRGQAAHSKAVSRAGHQTKADARTQYLGEDAIE